MIERMRRGTRYSYNKVRYSKICSGCSGEVIFFLFFIAAVLAVGVYVGLTGAEWIHPCHTQVYKVSVPTNAGGFGSSDWKHLYCNGYEYEDGGDLVLFDCLSSERVLVVDPERVIILEQ